MQPEARADRPVGPDEQAGRRQVELPQAGPGQAGGEATSSSPPAVGSPGPSAARRRSRRRDVAAEGPVRQLASARGWPNTPALQGGPEREPRPARPSTKRCSRWCRPSTATSPTASPPRSAKRSRRGELGGLFDALVDRRRPPVRAAAVLLRPVPPEPRAAPASPGSPATAAVKTSETLKVGAVHRHLRRDQRRRPVHPRHGHAGRRSAAAN